MVIIRLTMLRETGNEKGAADRSGGPFLHARQAGHAELNQ